MMNLKNYVKVAIKEEYLSGLPFKLRSRNSIAIVFSFFGDSEDVREFLQKASHRTRAYYVNTGGLKGFLEPSIFEILTTAKYGELQSVFEEVKIDIRALKK